MSADRPGRLAGEGGGPEGGGRPHEHDQAADVEGADSPGGSGQMDAGPSGGTSEAGRDGQAVSAEEARPARAAGRATAVIRLGRPTVVERILYGIAWGLLAVVGRGWLRAEFHGRENLPADGPYILAPVHRSNIDFMMAALCTRRRLRFLAKDTLWKPGVAGLWSALGGIPVARGTADRESLAACQKVLEAGEPLVMFPEGTRQSGPVVRPLFDGPTFVQARTGVPIIPVGIGGTERAMPKGAKGIRPVKVHVVIGEPLPAPEADGARAKRAAIRAQTALLYERVQELFDDAQRHTGHPNRR
ncbi:MAG TPA: lysophospholipid acyltransferase family protein [Acidimicrobiales bacterium]|nr:lysophospholipid acyltransferase family protein [Acidimicrobiales bacterium]